VQEKYTDSMRNIKIKNKLQSGGVRSAYDTNINVFTDAKKSLEEIKKAKRAAKRYMKRGGYKSRYQVGGMYADNTVASAGQGNVGNTSTVVYQESDPRLQQERISALESERKLLSQETEQMAQEIEQEAELDEAKIEQAGLEATQSVEQAGAITSSALEGAKSLGLIGEQKSAGQSVKEAVGAFKAVRAANQARAGFQAAKTGFNLAQSGNTALTLAKSSANVAKIGQQGLQTGKTLQQGFQLGKTATGIGGTATQFGGTAANLSGTAASGTSALGAAGSALSNVNVYAAAANLAGKGIKRLSDDDDATTWTAGEATGDILGTAGEYAGYGAMLGSVIPGVGNLVGAGVGAVIGAGVGVYKGLTGRKKARKEEAKIKAERQEKVDEFNQKRLGRFGAQLARVRAGEVKQKTYSGYDLGRNVIAQMGGMRMGIPRYGYAA